MPHPDHSRSEAAAALVRRLRERQALQRTARLHATVVAQSLDTLLRLEADVASAWPAGLAPPPFELTWSLPGAPDAAPGGLRIVAYDVDGRALAAAAASRSEAHDV